MSDEKKNTGVAQGRLIDVIEALAGHEVFGIRLRAVATAVQGSDPTVFRDLQLLERKGWAKQDENGLWRLSTKPVQIAYDFMAGINGARQNVDQTEHNYTRKPK